MATQQKDLTPLNSNKSLSPIPLICIAGTGRSGSTLLDLMLGSHSCIESAGELHNYRRFFSSAESQKRQCSCGLPLLECDFWKKVRQEIQCSQGTDLIDLKTPDEEAFITYNYNVFKAILQVSGKKIIVDSSKDYARIKRLERSELFEVYIIHLIRDGRAVSYSVEKTAERAGTDEVNKTGFFQSLIKWQAKNIAIRLNFGKRAKYICLKYEDFIDCTEDKLAKILNLANLEFEPNQLEFWNVVHHQFSGNRRIRLKGKQELKKDLEYLEQLSSFKWVLGTIIAFLGLSWFGYPLTRKM